MFFLQAEKLGKNSNNNSPSMSEHQVDKSKRTQSEKRKTSHFQHIHALILAHLNPRARQWKRYP